MISLSTPFVVLLAILAINSEVMEAQKRVGGMTEPGPATDEIQGLLDKVKGDVQTKTGKTLDTFKAITAGTQLVNGINYFVKVDVGGGAFIHVRFHKSFSGDVSLHSVQEGKSKADKLVYF